MACYFLRDCLFVCFSRSTNAHLTRPSNISHINGLEDYHLPKPTEAVVTTPSDSDTSRVPPGPGFLLTLNDLQVSVCFIELTFIDAW